MSNKKARRITGVYLAIVFLITLASLLFDVRMEAVLLISWLSPIYALIVFILLLE